MVYMSHYTFYMDEIINKNYLFQEKIKEESLFSYYNLTSIAPAFTSNSYTLICHNTNACMYQKYITKYKQRGRSFHIK